MRTHRLTALISPALLAVVTYGCTQDPMLSVALPSADEPEAEVVFSPGSMTAGPEFATSGVLEAPDGATRIGMLVDVRSPDAVGALTEVIEVRGFEADGTPTDWLAASVTWSEENYLVARADVGREIYGAQLRIPAGQLAHITNVTFAAVVPVVQPANNTTTQASLGLQRAGLSIPSSVRTRAQWGARATRCTGLNTSKWRMAIHHTFTPPTTGGSYEARLRGIQAYHMDTRGWCDVGYHFLVTDDGTVYEGRPLKYSGAHVGGHNTGNIGISFVGCYESGACDSMGSMVPSSNSLSGAAELIRSLGAQFGIAINSSNILGHGQHSGASTSCPGNRLREKIGTILEEANGQTPVIPPTDPTEQLTGRAVGVVWDKSTGADPSAPGVVRISSANISGSGKTIGVKGSSAYWELILPQGTHTLTAAAPGFAPSSRTVEIRAGQETWASIGLTPETFVDSTPQDGIVTVQVINGSGAPVPASAVHVGGAPIQMTNTQGQATFSLSGGQVVTLTAYGAHLKARSLQYTVNGDQTLQIALEDESPDSWTGTIQGVVWDETVTTSPSADGSLRLDDALVICDCGKARAVRSSDAYWSFDLAAGSYTFTALAEGYQADSKTVSIGWGGAEWASIGLSPAP